MIGNRGRSMGKQTRWFTALCRLNLARLIVFFLALELLYKGTQFIGLELINQLPAESRGPVLAAIAITAILALFATYTQLVRRLESRKPTELVPIRPFNALAGVLTAFSAYCAVYAILWAIGVAHWNGFSGPQGLPMAAAVALVSGIAEELIFRGAVYRLLESSLGTAWALILSAILFGATHLSNPHATWFSALAIAIEAGLMLPAAYAWTRSLWLPIGLHIGWNFTEGGVFGASVSGRFGGQGVVNMPLSGPDFVTGGSFGPEGSVVTTAVCLGLGLLFAVIAYSRNRYVPMQFKM